MLVDRRHARPLGKQARHRSFVSLSNGVKEFGSVFTHPRARERAGLLVRLGWLVVERLVGEEERAVDSVASLLSAAHTATPITIMGTYLPASR